MAIVGAPPIGTGAGYLAAATDVLARTAAEAWRANNGGPRNITVLTRVGTAAESVDMVGLCHRRDGETTTTSKLHSPQPVLESVGRGPVLGVPRVPAGPPQRELRRQRRAPRRCYGGRPLSRCVEDVGAEKWTRAILPTPSATLAVRRVADYLEDTLIERMEPYLDVPGHAENLDLAANEGQNVIDQPHHRGTAGRGHPFLRVVRPQRRDVQRGCADGGQHPAHQHPGNAAHHVTSTHYKDSKWRRDNSKMYPSASRWPSTPSRCSARSGLTTSRVSLKP